MPSSGLPVPVTLRPEQKLPHPIDTQHNAVVQAAYNLSAGKVAGAVGFSVPAAAVMPTAMDAQFNLVVQAAYNAKKGTDAVPQ